MSVTAQYEADKKTIEERAITFKGRFFEKDRRKKSLLQLEGCFAQERAQEFARLNYDLNPGASPLQPHRNQPTNDITELELEALAMELLYYLCPAHIIYFHLPHHEGGLFPG